MRIEWTEPALDDLRAIRDYIAKDSRFFAMRFVERIFEVAERLQEFPEMGRRVPEAEQESVRELIFRNYRIIYRVETHRVVILSLVHGSRNFTGAILKPWEIF